MPVLSDFFFFLDFLELNKYIFKLGLQGAIILLIN